MPVGSTFSYDQTFSPVPLINSGGPPDFGQVFEYDGFGQGTTLVDAYVGGLHSPLDGNGSSTWTAAFGSGSAPSSLSLSSPPSDGTIAIVYPTLDWPDLASGSTSGGTSGGGSSSTGTTTTTTGGTNTLWTALGLYASVNPNFNPQSAATAQGGSSGSSSGGSSSASGSSGGSSSGGSSSTTGSPPSQPNTLKKAAPQAGRPDYGSGSAIYRNAKPTKPPEFIRVSEPSFPESIIPVWGSGKQSIYYYQNGHPVLGTIYVAVAVSDVVPAKLIATLGYKLVVKAGSKAAALLLVKEAATLAVEQEIKTETALVAGGQAVKKATIQTGETVAKEGTEETVRALKELAKKNGTGVNDAEALAKLAKDAGGGKTAIEALEKAAATEGVNSGTTAVLKGGYYEVNGFKFSEFYYNKLWNTGRGSPSLVAREVLEGAGGIGVADSIKVGFFRFEYGGWELVYNPITKEVWHLQPIK